MTLGTQDTVVTMSGQYFNTLPRICVYEWIRDNTWLYVGCTTRGLGRLFGHEKIDKSEGVLDKDIIRMTRFTAYADAARYEKLLIREKQPLYNSAYNPARKRKLDANARLIKHVNHIRKLQKRSPVYMSPDEVMSLAKETMRQEDQR